MYDKKLHQEYLDKQKERIADGKKLVLKVIRSIDPRFILKNPQKAKRLFLQKAMKSIYPLALASSADGRKFLKVKTDAKS